ncbi:SRPBCC family protein [Gorillibacterium sp. sgz5001074]|uniref:SRPBCC family protein n=1 Tax=Gorillibacterium sp. sgz5001074 TaxID=3446695 RepID=UPI003F66ED1D
MPGNEPLDEVEARVGEREFVLERIYDAPRELLFRVFTEPEHLAQWWAPGDYTVPVCKVDLRPGGQWHYSMRSPEGEDHWALAVFREIQPPERIVYSCTFADEFANRTEGIPEHTATITFSEADGKTKVEVRISFESAEDLKTTVRMGMIDGLTMTLNSLPKLLADLLA